jgi:hypothetical protein
MSGHTGRHTAWRWPPALAGGSISSVRAGLTFDEFLRRSRETAGGRSTKGLGDRAVLALVLNDFVHAGVVDYDPASKLNGGLDDDVKLALRDLEP